MIYLRFTADRSIESHIIQFGTRWWCSHVEFIDANSGITLGSRHRGGVQERPYDYCKPSREEWWEAPGIDEAYVAAKQVIGSLYDTADGFSFVFSRDWHHPGRYTCSGLVDAAFKKVGKQLTNSWMPIHRVSPRDIMASPLLMFFSRVR